MPAGTIALRRVESNRPVMGRDYNLLIDTLLANQGGRVRLWGDDGLEKDRLTGLTASSGNYASDLSSAAGRHQRVRKSDDTLDVWKVEDAGATLVGALAVTGATTLTGNVGITGNTTLVGTLSVSGLVAAAAAMTVGTTLTVGGHASAGTLSVGAAALVGTEKLYVNGSIRLPNNNSLVSTYSGTDINLVRLDSSGIFRLGTPAVLRTFVYGADDFELIDSSGNVVFKTVGNQMTFFNGSSTAGRGNVGSAATDPASTMTLANNLRSLVRSFNLSS